MEIKNTSEIRLKIELDNSNVPQHITWQASDSGEEEKECKAFILSIWDAADRNTLRIDLWTKDMRIDDMTSHFFQTLFTMADTYERATKVKISDDMKQFCEGLAKKIAENLKSNVQG